MPKGVPKNPKPPRRQTAVRLSDAERDTLDDIRRHKGHDYPVQTLRELIRNEAIALKIPTPPDREREKEEEG
jgi:hypothetical protein